MSRDWLLKVLPLLFPLLLTNPVVYHHRGWCYIAILIAAIGINVVSVRISQGLGNWSWDPRSHIPTLAGIARVIICLFLVIPYAGETYEKTQVIPLSYLIYIAILCSVYDRPEYHYSSFRSLRIAIDLLAAAVLFWTFNGLQNLTWVVFLVPITTLGRYYSAGLSYGVAAASWLFILIASVWGFTWPFVDFVGKCVVYFVNAGTIDESKFVDYLTAGNHLKYWVILKGLGVIASVFTVVTLIYREETRLRWGSIFEFGYTLLLAMKYERVIAESATASGTSTTTSESASAVLSREILDLLCIEANSEVLIAIEERKPSDVSSGSGHPLVKAVCQTHGMTTEHVSASSFWDDGAWEQYKALVADMEESDNRRTYSSPVFNQTIRRLVGDRNGAFGRKLEAATVRRLAAKIGASPFDVYRHNAIWVYNHPSDQNWLTRIREVFFPAVADAPATHETVSVGISRCRTRAGLYGEFRVVCAVVMSVPGYRLIFVNNLPSNYRIVPRRFWGDGLDRLQIAQFVLCSELRRSA